MLGDLNKMAASNSSEISLNKGVSLIIPVMNEEKTLKYIIALCSKQKVVKQLVVVNDGSTDNTKRILNNILKTNLSKRSSLALTVIHHKRNLGKGAAIKTGLKKVKGKYVMVQDADTEYSPEEIKFLYKQAEESKEGIVFGSRSMYKRKGYLLAQVGNWYLNTMFNFLFGFHLTDSYTCYKLMPRKIWQELELESNGFEIDAELLAKLGITKHHIIEVPISYNPRKYSEGKKIKWVDLIKATSAAFKVRIS